MKTIKRALCRQSAAKKRRKRYRREKSREQNNHNSESPFKKKKNGQVNERMYGLLLSCVWFSIDLSNIMHNKSQSRPYWFTSFRGLETQICEKSALILLHFSSPSFGKLLPSVDWTSHKTTWESRKSSTRFGDSYNQTKCVEFRLPLTVCCVYLPLQPTPNRKVAQHFFSLMRSILVGHSEFRIF